MSVGVAIVTLKVMPESPDTDLEKIYSDAAKIIVDFGATVGKKDIEPVAFGLKSLVIMFSMSEALGSTEEVEGKVAALPGVSSAHVTDMRRALG
jgi:elongation factor 1-beta